MPSSDYRTGYRDGFADGHSQAERERAAINGPDINLYEFIGGPYHGQVRATNGMDTIVVMLPLDRPRWYSYRSDPLLDDDLIRTGTYRRREVQMAGTYRRKTVYVYEGTR